MTASLATFRASGAQRLSLCPGSARAEAGLPEDSNPDAASGQRIHAILACIVMGAPVTGAPADMDVAASMFGHAEEALGFPMLSDPTREAEVEMADGLWTGHLDAWLRHPAGTEYHVIDWKTGWADVVDAAANAQLRVYACLVARFMDDGLPVCGHIVTRTGATSVRYEPDAMRAAWDEMESVAQAALADEAKRIPSPLACKYCRAFGTERCPETLALPAVAKAAMPDADEKVRALVPSQLAELLGLATLVERLAKKLREEAKVRLEADPNAIPGWTLKPGAVRRSIEETATAVDRLVKAGLPQDAVLAACSLSVPEAAKVASDVRNLKRKDGEAWVMAALDGLVEEKRAAPSLAEAMP